MRRGEYAEASLFYGLWFLTNPEIYFPHDWSVGFKRSERTISVAFIVIYCDRAELEFLEGRRGVGCKPINVGLGEYGYVAVKN